jgi:hypothetical protein
MSVSPEEFAATQQRLQQLESERAEMNLRMARSDAYAKYPHLRDTGLLEQYMGSPDQIGVFADKLAERIPPPAPTPAPLTNAPPGTPTSPPVVQQQPPAVTTPPPPAAPAPPQSLGVPAPTEILQQQSAEAMKYDDIRLRMEQGLATRQEVLDLSQNAPRREVDLGDGRRGFTGGFTAAVKHLSAERRARGIA